MSIISWGRKGTRSRIPELVSPGGPAYTAQAGVCLTLVRCCAAAGGAVVSGGVPVISGCRRGVAPFAEQRAPKTQGAGSSPVAPARLGRSERGRTDADHV